MLEGDKIRNSTSFNWGGFHSALGRLRLVSGTPGTQTAEIGFLLLPISPLFPPLCLPLLTSFLLLWDGAFPYGRKHEANSLTFSFFQLWRQRQSHILLSSTTLRYQQKDPFDPVSPAHPGQWLCPGMWATCTATATSQGHPNSARHKFSEGRANWNNDYSVLS